MFEKKKQPSEASTFLELLDALEDRAYQWKMKGGPGWLFFVAGAAVAGAASGRLLPAFGGGDSNVGWMIIAMVLIASGCAVLIVEHFMQIRDRTKDVEFARAYLLECVRGVFHDSKRNDAMDTARLIALATDIPKALAKPKP